MRKNIPERLCELLIMFYKKFPTGGFLHIVTDDGNWETKSFVWSLLNWQTYNDLEDVKWIREHEKEVIEMCTLMLELPEKERYKIWSAVRKWKEVRIWD